MTIFLIDRGLNQLFHHAVLLIIVIYHNEQSSCGQSKKTEVPHQFFFIWGSSSSGKKGIYVSVYIYIYAHHLPNIETKAQFEQERELQKDKAWNNLEI